MVSLVVLRELGDSHGELASFRKLCEYHSDFHTTSDGMMYSTEYGIPCSAILLFNR